MHVLLVFWEYALKMSKSAGGGGCLADLWNFCLCTCGRGFFQSNNSFNTMIYPSGCADDLHYDLL